MRGISIDIKCHSLSMCEQKDMDSRMQIKWGKAFHVALYFLQFRVLREQPVSQQTSQLHLFHAHREAELVPAATDARWHSSLTSPFCHSLGSSLSWDMRWAFVESFAPFSLRPIISALRWAYFLTGLRHNQHFPTNWLEPLDSIKAKFLSCDAFFSSNVGTQWWFLSLIVGSKKPEILFLTTFQTLE